MSSRRQKRRSDLAPMPAAGAGLLRFFEEDTPGIRVSPRMLVVFSVALIIFCTLIQFAYA
ncbi:MAG: preprotein translocase subunit Sec61beta [Candidatus Bathyarchaeia archaeon]